MWLLAEESQDRVDPEALSSAAQRACAKLSRRLTDIVTPVGSRVVLARSLHLARLRFPFLSGVSVGTGAESSLDGLRESVQGIDPSEARAGLAEIVAGIIGLLVTFIGMELTVRLVRDVWPDAPLEEFGTARREA